MSWPTYLHHLTLHMPIALLPGMAALSLYARAHDDATTQRLVRLAGLVTLALTSAAALSGILSAPGWLGGDGPKGLTDHRDLALTTWCVTLCAALAYDYGARRAQRDWRMIGTGAWCVAAFAVLGAGHWGGAQQHPEVVPWERSSP